MVNHQRRQCLAANQDDLAVDQIDVLDRVPGIYGCRYENPLRRSMTLERPGKFLDFWPANVPFPAFRLDVDCIKAKLVLLDDSIDSTVATFADGPSRVLTRATLPHGDQQINNQALEEGRAGGLDLLKQVGLEFAAQPPVCGSESVFGCLVVGNGLGWNGLDQRSWCFIALGPSGMEVSELFELFEILDVNTCRVLREDCKSALGDSEDSPFG